MKMFLRYLPELAGFLVGLLDLLPRLLANLMYAPSEARLHGSLLYGNIPHPNGTMALGLGTMSWFAIAAGVLAVMYGGVRLAEHLAQASNSGFRTGRFLLACVGGVLVLNVVEGMTRGSVTNYIGIAYGTRFTAINLGDLLVWLSLCGMLPALAVAVAIHLGGTGRTR
jgi:hypothetical protein